LNVTVRGVDAEVFRRFKAKAAEEGVKLGEALTQAMEIWVKQRSAKPRQVTYKLPTSVVGYLTVLTKRLTSPFFG